MASKLKVAKALQEELRIPEDLLFYVSDYTREWRSNWEKASAISIAAEGLQDGYHWLTRTWNFTRIVKAQFPTLSPEEALRIVPWAETDFDEDDQIQFLAEWNAVRHIPGIEITEWALGMAKKYRVLPPEVYQHLKNFTLFVSFAAWLQVAVGQDTPIFLPTRKLAPMLGVKSNKTVANMANLAVSCGILELVSEHTRSESKLYRFDLTNYRGPIEKWLKKSSPSEITHIDT
jgi:hypothetical protein